MAKLEIDLNSITDLARRDFVAKCGKFAAVTPPAVTYLLSTTLSSGAIAASSKGNNGFGNGSGDGVPGNSGFQDSNR